MDILVTYDVNTLTKEGRRRLRKLSKACQGYGQRVQFSVFECTVNETQKEQLVMRLTTIIDKNEDSLRLYQLRGSRETVVECFGINSYIDFKGTLVV